MADNDQQVQPTPDTPAPAQQATPEKLEGQEAKKEQVSGLFDNPMFNTMVGELVKAQFGEDIIEPKPSEQEPEKKEEETKPVESEEQTDGNLQKRFQDAQKMIGKQGNEIGELRATVEALNKKLETTSKSVEAPNNNKKPYWDVILEAKESELIGLLSETYKGSGNEPDSETLRSQAWSLKTAAKMVSDMVDDKIKPLMQVLERQKVTDEYQQKAAEFSKEHPELDIRVPYMKAFIDKAYPNGVPADRHFEVAHLAYFAVEDIVAKAKTDAENQKKSALDQQKAINSSVASAGSKTKPPVTEVKKSPYDLAIEKAWNSR